MNIKEIIGETTEYEKKEIVEYKSPKSWLKTVSAFANGKGGLILFGIDNSDNIVGITSYRKDSELISEIIKYHIDPIPKFRLSIEHFKNNKSIIVLNIDEGKETPYYFKDSNNQIAYMRIGNESIPCDHNTLNSLILNGLNKTYDSLLSEYKIENYSFNDFFETYNNVHNKKLEIADLESFDIVQDGYLTNAGVLLADNCPLINSRIFCTRWKGLDKGQDALDSIEYEHLSLIKLLHKGIEFISKHNNKGWKKQSFGRIDYYSYPKRAVFEGLCNALIHRDYLETGSEIHIDIFDDRLEIYSPGGMLEGGNIQEKDINSIKSKRRNPIIADIFGRLDYIERRGSGFTKIFEDYRKYSNGITPQFDSSRSSFVLTLKNTQYRDIKSSLLAGAQAGPLPGPLPGSLPGPPFDAIPVSDVIKGEVSPKDYYVLYDTNNINKKFSGQILAFCLKPRSRKEIQELIDVKSKSYTKTKILKPLLDKRYLCLTNPDVPNDMNQKYYTNPQIIYKKNRKKSKSNKTP